MLRVLAAWLLLAALPADAAIRLIVTVIERRTGMPVEDLKAEEFAVYDDKQPKTVESAEYARRPIDVMLLLDSGLAGGMVQPVAERLIAAIENKEQMAIVSYDSSAEMVQDFTASKEILRSSLSRVRYGNTPRVYDALFAAMNGGFEHAAFRRVILLLTSGLDGGSRMGERDVVRLARKNGISIYPVFPGGFGRSYFDDLARKTGGASFSLRDLEKSGERDPAARVFGVMRAHYTISVQGNLGLGEKVKVEVKREGKYLVSALPLD